MRNTGGFKKDEPEFERLGELQIVEANKDLYIANIFGQMRYGSDGQRYTDYGALKTSFRELKRKRHIYEMLYGKKLQVYFPAKFGSDRGGGNWTIVSQMIDFYFPDAIICQL